MGQEREAAPPSGRARFQLTSTYCVPTRKKNIFFAKLRLYVFYCRTSFSLICVTRGVPSQGLW